MEVGRLLKSVIYDMRARKSVYNPLNSVRSDLDDWVQCEYDREELSSDVFFDLYYHEDVAPQTALTGAARLPHHASTLVEAKRILARHYPDCAPLRSMFQGDRQGDDRPWGPKSSPPVPSGPADSSPALGLGLRRSARRQCPAESPTRSAIGAWLG